MSHERLIHRRVMERHTDGKIKPLRKCFMRLQCVLDYTVWEKEDNAD